MPTFSPTPLPEGSFVVAGGRVVSTAGAAGADLVVRDGRVAALLPPGTAPRDGAVVDAGGLLVLPGAVDAHVHFDEPGRTSFEGFASGSAAAAAGGVTTVVDMPIDSDPPTLDARSAAAKVAAARASSVVDVALWGGLVPGNLAELDGLLAAGVVGLKAFLCDSGWEAFPPADRETLEAGMRAAARAGRVVAVHCEDPGLLTPGPPTSDRRPVAAEVAGVAAAGAAAVRTGARLHVVHCSSADAVLEARRWPGTTVETCPHYLHLTDADADALGPVAWCAPPVRDRANRDRLWALVRDGLVDTVASDHSPCPPALKDGPVPFAGVAGVQTTLSLLLAPPPDGGPPLDLARLSALRTAAATLLGLPGKGALAPGFDADLVLVDPAGSWVVGEDTLHQRHRASPFAGRRLPGEVVATFVRGRCAYSAVHGPSTRPAGRLVVPGRRPPLPATAPP